MKYKSLGIDIDGILRNFVSSVERVYKEHYPEHKVLDRSDYDLKTWFPIGGKIYDFVFKDNVKEIYLYAKSYPHAVRFMEYLGDLGYKVTIVTSQPNEDCIYYTKKWLEKNEVYYDKLIFESQKAEVKEIDVLLDDSTKNLNEFAETDRLAVCMNRSWNKDYEGPRVKTYKQFIEMIEK